ncbi:MAG: GNAT family N-acetyltransferase [Waddliaceae bacterium]
MPAPPLLTKRLLLRQWKDSDLPLFAKMNADARVMKYFPSRLSKEESDSLAKKIQKELREKEYGLWAVEVIGAAPFIGFLGLHYRDFPAPFTPCIEIGWRLVYEHWGKGYAFEAAEKVVEYAFNTLKLKEIVSFTTPDNKRSWNLMRKLGMNHNPEDDFYHTKLPKDHPLGFHVLYRKRNPNEKHESSQILSPTQKNIEA